MMAGDPSRRGGDPWVRDARGVTWGYAGWGRARDQADGGRVAGDAGGEGNLGHGQRVGGVGDGRARNLGSGGWVWCRTGASHRSDTCGGRSGDQSNSARNGSDNAWIARDIGSTDTGEVGERGLDLFFGCTPCLDTADDLICELMVRAETAGLRVGSTLGHKREPGVDTLGHRVRAICWWR